MRLAGRSDRQRIEQTVSTLIALADAGLQHVEILKVLTWLGVQVNRPTGPPQPRPGPGADPLTGCRPAGPS